MIRRALAVAMTYVPDVMVISGVILLAYGLSLYSPPLFPITCGVGLVALVGLGSRAS